MTLEIKIPSPGESISEVEIGKWLVSDGAMVEKNQEIAEVESDKATFSLSASDAGRIKILVKEGERIAVGSVACVIETEAQGLPKIEEENVQSQIEEPKAEKKTEEEVTRAENETEVHKTEEELSPFVESQKTQEQKVDYEEREIQEEFTKPAEPDNSKVKFTAAAKAVMAAEGLSVDEVMAGIRRLTRQDVETVVKILKSTATGQQEEVRAGTSESSRTEEHTPMSPLRRKLSQRLVAVKNETAMLTTFNEIDMFRLVQLRAKYQKVFTEKFGFKLGYMSFFTKAASIALSQFPVVNSMIEGGEIITPGYQDIGIAVQTGKGLMVPIIRDVSTKTIAQLESEIAELAEKARNKKLTVQEMAGGTFTITNGGLFGSLFSTPILNPPQSAILGMHAIKERPIAIEGRVEIRPMMYVALTYDHRLIDGKDSVSFLFRIKELIETPESMIFPGKDPAELLLGL